MISKETLPSHWDFLPIRSIFYESDKRNGNDNYELLSVTQNQGIIKQSVDSKKDTSNEDKSKYKVVLKSSIAYNKMRMWQGAVGINELEDGIVSPAYVVINPINKEINTKYYFYLFKSTYMISQFGKYSYGLVDDMNSLRYEHFRNIYIPIPPIKEQDKIVQKIDSNIQNINIFIKNKIDFIKLLKEQQEAIINKAVTKGINKNTKFVSSNNQFLPDIPQHWNIRKIATIGKFSKGGGIAKDNLVSEGLPAIVYGNIYTKYNIKTFYFTNYIPKKISTKSIIINNGDLLFTGSGETKEEIGKCIVYLGKEQAYAGGDIIILKQNTENSLYLSYALNSKMAVMQKILMAKGEIIVHIYSSNLREILIPLPPLNEQNMIVDYLETELSKIDTIIEKTQKEIELIQEYKTSFISEVVIGK